MGTPLEELAAKMPQLSPQELEQFAAMVERMRQLRRHAGIPDGMSVQDGVAAHIISAEELERARWGTRDETSSPQRSSKSRRSGRRRCFALPRLPVGLRNVDVEADHHRHVGAPR